MGTSNQGELIPVAEPVFIGNEKTYVADCIDSTWISSSGKYIRLFEESFAEFCGVEHAVSCSNGTVALHVALLGLGVEPGDEVIIPTLTYVATANAVTYCGATPVLVDSEPVTWNMDPMLIESLVTSRTKGIIVVHLFGHPVDMDPIMAIAEKYGLFVLEDAAEAHGAEYKGRRAGSIGHAATFSFYGNKIITTGEGGMVVTNDDGLAARMRQLKGQGMQPGSRYWFPIVGYNYRMTNIEAAIGLAQLEQIDWHLARRRENAQWYAEFLGDCELVCLQPEMPWAKNVYWINSVVLGESVRLTRDEVMDALAAKSIETRPFFYPMHVLPIYEHLTGPEGYPVADMLSSRGINLPSSAKLTREDVARVSSALIYLVKAMR
ncbi:MAG: DegT/DnrJ/EryC1/StrS family aminotransferase [Candidatus Promineofilum sp.]|nr:DegT/DnrJ/EryC1/StrS family aminotransferase [Promineifilum sp.]